VFFANFLKINNKDIYSLIFSALSKGNHRRHSGQGPEAGI
jgi:hypothetical protein